MERDRHLFDMHVLATADLILCDLDDIQRLCSHNLDVASPSVMVSRAWHLVSSAPAYEAKCRMTAWCHYQLTEETWINVAPIPATLCVKLMNGCGSGVCLAIIGAGQTCQAAHASDNAPCL